MGIAAAEWSRGKLVLEELEAWLEVPVERGTRSRIQEDIAFAVLAFSYVGAYIHPPFNSHPPAICDSRKVHKQMAT